MIAQQTWLFLYTVLFGILFAAVYDTLRAFRRAVPHALFLIQLEDIVFWLGVGAASTLLYGCTLSRFIVKGLSALLRTLVKILALPWRGIGKVIQKIKKIFRKKKKTH